MRLRIWFRKIYDELGMQPCTSVFYPAGCVEKAKTGNDKRFRDPEWTENPYFNLLRDTYLVTAALDMAIAQRSPAGVIHHSDQLTTCRR